jgi:hypothetical protein
MRRLLLLAIGIGGCELVSGAPDFEVSPLVGDWQSKASVLGEKVEAHFVGDGSGDVRFPIPISLTEVIVLHGDATWDEIEDNRFAVEVVCDDSTYCTDATPKPDRTLSLTCRTLSEAQRVECIDNRPDAQPFELERQRASED